MARSGFAWHAQIRRPPVAPDTTTQRLAGSSAKIPLVTCSPRSEAALVEESVFDIVHHAFDFALGARTANAVGLDGKAVVAGEVGELRIQFAGAEPHLLHVVVEDFLRPTTEKLERVLMTTHESG